MRYKFLLVPPAIVMTVVPAVGMDIQTLEAAQARLFPGATFTPADITLTESQVNQLKTDYNVPVMRPQIKVWKASTGGLLFLDQVFGLNDTISYLVALDDKGTVTGTEILVCVEGFCDISTPKWRAEFIGKKHKVGDLTKEISNTSGATLSASHVTEGVKKILAIHALFMSPGASAGKMKK
jgi:hypothetical protein